MITIKNIIIQPQKIAYSIQVEPNQKIRELYVNIKNNYTIPGDIENWSCFSSIQQKELDINDKLGDNKNDLLTIYTNCVQLQINITDDRNQKYKVHIIFKKDDTLQEITQSILVYCKLSQDENNYFVDLFINDQQLNTQFNRLKTLKQLQMNNNTVVQAKIRKIRNFCCNLFTEDKSEQKIIAVPIDCPVIQFIAEKILKEAGLESKYQLSNVYMQFENQTYNGTSNVQIENFDNDSEVNIIIIQKPQSKIQIKKNFDMIKNVPVCETHGNNPISLVCIQNHQCSQRKLCSLCLFEHDKNFDQNKINAFQIFAEKLDEKLQKLESLFSIRDFIQQSFKLIQQKVLNELQILQSNLISKIDEKEQYFQDLIQVTQDLQTNPLYEISQNQIEKLVNIIQKNDELSTQTITYSLENWEILQQIKKIQDSTNKYVDSIQSINNEMVKCQVIIPSLRKSLLLESNKQTKTFDILEEIKNFYKISTPTNQWKCYSEQRRKYISEELDNKVLISDELLFIQT